MRRTFIAGVVAALFLASGASLVGQGRQSTPFPPIPAYAESGAGPRFNGFGVSLVLGEAQGGVTDKLPAGATKALLDLKDFLPYKSYRVLDTLWMQPSTSHPTLKGLEGKSYELYIDANGYDQKNVSVRMVRLWDSSASRAVTTPPALTTVPEISPGRSGRAVFGNVASPLIDVNSLNINFGETVVVGTSRLQGDRALILLITALTR
jgi:hypothetical protein